MSLARQVASNTLIQVISKVIGTIIGLVALAIITRYLGSVGFGQYTTIITFASFFAIIADLGLTLVTGQMINKPGIDQTKVLNNLFAFRLLSALILVGLAPIVINFFPYTPAIKIGVITVSIAYFFLSLNQIFVSIFQKYLRTERIVIAEVISRLVLVAMIIIVKLGDYGLTGLLWAMIASNLISFLLHYVLALRFAKVGFSFDKVIWREIMSRSWPLMLTIVFNLIYLKADILFLSLLKSDYEVGWYGAAYKVVDVLATIPFLFAGIMLPILVNQWHDQSKENFIRTLQRMFDLTALAVIPLLVGGYFLADPMMLYVAGSDFIAAGPILQILLLAVVAVFFTCVFTHAMVSMDKQKQLIGYYLFTALTAIPVYYFGIKYWSYFGAAWGTVYSESLIGIFALILVWRHTKWLPKLRLFGKSLLATGIMALLLSALQNWASQSPGQLVVVMMLGVVVYAIFLYWFKGISPEDLLALARKQND
ncbi:MAG: Heteropolysaccharide repeat unit export protein [Candidatus Falkowbacteria bacterium GW2011_GWA2_39_24]|uniref:Heteropolysaccharide repeat unit export protein n=1 Tax=Candidatus Falkowbacteria bacterium GW2011_GWA2_39_24 TaxID=1618634 RepID=A0A0G0NDM2_9BACT|nr:MAG: Heteropolysaccharide repeat unit export protein [Candidatus Falkowbacteria bacterium GW2011_GWA2_39_24]